MDVWSCNKSQAPWSDLPGQAIELHLLLVCRQSLSLVLALPIRLAQILIMLVAASICGRRTVGLRCPSVKLPKHLRVVCTLHGYMITHWGYLSSSCWFLLCYPYLRILHPTLPESQRSISLLGADSWLLSWNLIHIHTVDTCSGHPMPHLQKQGIEQRQ
jgi:hypothetical protein